MGDELNVRSDMYSVGVTLFYLLTGRTPFEGKNMVQLLANALEKTGAVALAVPAGDPAVAVPRGAALPGEAARVALRQLR